MTPVKTPAYALANTGVAIDADLSSDRSDTSAVSYTKKLRCDARRSSETRRAASRYLALALALIQSITSCSTHATACAEMR